MSPTAHGDFETRSELDLKAVGLWNYARHPSTDVWCFAYAFNDEEPKIWVPGYPIPTRLEHHIENGGKFVSHNAQFELEIWNEIMVKRCGWPLLTPAQTFCTMAQAYAMGLPGGLEDASLAVGLSVNKDTEGRALMLRYARPWQVNPTKWLDECPSFTHAGQKISGAEGLKRVYAYCLQDVRVEQALCTRLVPLSDRERQIWLMDYRINARGVGVDLETARAGAAMCEEIKKRAGEKLAIITEGAVTSPTALSALKQWCAAQGVEVDSLAKDTLEEWLTKDLPDNVRDALIQRQEAGKASVAKLDRLLTMAGGDERLHQIVQYHGASTGRWAARGVQVHNLPRKMPKAAVVEEILGHVRDGAIEWIDIAYGPPMDVISQCLRSFFVPKNGNVLVAGDFSAVEGRGTAWLSGEEWKLEVFRRSDRKEGPDVYCVTAAALLHMNVQDITEELRQKPGKIAELAFGYQGGVGAGKRFSPDTPTHTLNEWKLAWRAKHPRIVATWEELENAAVAAVEQPGQTFRAGHGDRHVRFKKAGSFLWCRLPSGRVMCYPYPKLLPGLYGKAQLTYMTVPSENDKGKIIQDVKNANNWARIGTYGGALMENVVQAICRDLLADTMIAMDSKGAQIVLHVHDEPVNEVPRAAAKKAREAMQRIMRTPPDWAPDFPLWADCKILERYGKG
jgi:DNA polymerase